jgi:hypothetical protein
VTARCTTARAPSLVGALIVPLTLGLLLVGVDGSWHEGFDSARLDPARWVVTEEGDFKESAVDVVDVSDRGVGDFRLRLRADTRGTRDDTVKFLGVRTVKSLPIKEGTRIGVTLDWNDQANGSYLSAGLVLTPEATRRNPLGGRDWLQVEYVGVPPGHNARLSVALCSAGRARTLFTEGWPESNRHGRRIDVQELRLVFAESSFEIHENGRRVFESTAAVPFHEAYLHLQLSSHSNYPPREVYFDDVRVSRGPRPLD